jgi:hypothetical protein
MQLCRVQAQLRPLAGLCASRQPRTNLGHAMPSAAPAVPRHARGQQVSLAGPFIGAPIAHAKLHLSHSWRM